MDFLGIIPARYESSRFPGKPLVEIKGKPMIQHVYERTSLALNNVYVATDDERIANIVKSFGGKVLMTSKSHPSGTDRCCEAACIVSEEKSVGCDVVINIQGDEPFLETSQIASLQNCFDDEDTEIATLIKKVTVDEELFNENQPKVITDVNNFAIYFSRSPLPHLRGVDKIRWLKEHVYYKHIGIYAYRFNVLQALCKLPPSSLELAESLEQNRWIEHGYHIKTAVTDVENIAVDTPEDLIKIKNS